MNTALIQTNLSDEFARRQKKHGPAVRMPAAFGVAIAAAILVLGGLYLVVHFRSERLRSTRAALERLAGPAAESERLQKECDRLAAQVKILQQWRASRIEWSELWQRLAGLIPETTYLSEIIVSNPDASGDNQRLQLRGHSLGASGESAILEFVRNLKMAPAFSNAFPTITLTQVMTEQDEKAFSIDLMRSPASGVR
ncbi:PilN domain-containing protein [bacterium]|nr:PilN domain-containing protein [bacterium]